jgi:hypothetical protein
VRTVLRLVSVLVFVLICLTLWVGVRAWLAKDHLEASADLVNRLQTQLEQGDATAAHRTLVKLQDETGDAVRLTGDPVWRFAQHLPWGGDDLKAVHQVSVAGHTLSVASLPAVTTAAADVNRLSNSGGDLTPVQLLAVARRLQAPLATAQAGVHQAQAQIGTVDSSSLFGPVRTGVAQFTSGLDRLSTELKALITTDNAAIKSGTALGG